VLWLFCEVAAPHCVGRARAFGQSADVCAVQGKGRQSALAGTCLCECGHARTRACAWVHARTHAPAIRFRICAAEIVPRSARHFFLLGFEGQRHWPATANALKLDPHDKRFASERQHCSSAVGATVRSRSQPSVRRWDGSGAQAGEAKRAPRSNILHCNAMQCSRIPHATLRDATCNTARCSVRAAGAKRSSGARRWGSADFATYVRAVLGGTGGTGGS
jgi:hypothetical protein